MTYYCIFYCVHGAEVTDTTTVPSKVISKCEFGQISILIICLPNGIERVQGKVYLIFATKLSFQSLKFLFCTKMLAL